MIYPDLKYKISERANAVLFYSEKFNQMIYIKTVNQKKSISKQKFVGKRNGLKDKITMDSIRRMQSIYGKKRGYKRFIQAYKLYIMIAPNISKKIYRYLWALNILLTKKREKTSFLIYENSTIPKKNIAGSICGKLYTQYKSLIDICKKTIESNPKIETPFSELKVKLDDLEYACNKLQSKYYKLMNRETLKKKYKKEFNNHEWNMIIHNLGAQQIIKPIGEELHVEVKEKDRYKPDLEIT